MDKRILVASYWLGILCTVLALISRGCMALNIMPPRFGAPGGLAIDYLSYFHAAALFFMLSIATWCKAAFKS